MENTDHLTSCTQTPGFVLIQAPCAQRDLILNEGPGYPFTSSDWRSRPSLNFL